MEEVQLTEQMMVEEINLRELLFLFWKKKFIIISISLIVALVTGIVSIFIITPEYHTRLNIIINMPDTYSTKYGDYDLPISTNEQYINLIISNDILARTIIDMGFEDMTIEELRKRISVIIPESKNGIDQNSFNIIVSADNPEEARRLAQTLFENYSKFIDVLTIEGAVDYFINKFSVDLSALEVSLERTRDILSKNEALLAETPQTINQKEAMDELFNSQSVSDFVILEKIINPNYTKIENDVIENKQSISNIENTIITYEQYLEELHAVKESIDDFESGQNMDIIYGKFKKITETNIHLPSDPIAPSRQTSPNTSLNIVIGALVGGMIGLMAIYVKGFWFKAK